MLQNAATRLGRAIRRLYDEHGDDCGGGILAELHLLYGGPTPLQAGAAWRHRRTLVMQEAGIWSLEMVTIGGRRRLRTKPLKLPAEHERRLGAAFS